MMSAVEPVSTELGASLAALTAVEEDLNKGWNDWKDGNNDNAEPGIGGAGCTAKTLKNNKTSVLT
jgi:hypothetical protein